MTYEEAIEHGHEMLEVFGGDTERFAMTAIRALEKQIPMKPISRWTGNETVVECPNCKKYPFDLSEYQWARQFCGNCGQAIDWSEEE